MTKLQKIGIGVMAVSLVLGIVGTGVSIYLSFVRLETAEFGGLGPVGDQIRNALIFSLAGFVGTVGGAVLLIRGRSRSTPAKSKQPMHP